MLALIVLLLIFIKIRSSTPKRKFFVLLVVITFIVFEIIYQFFVISNWGSLTVGSDETRYFDIVNNLSIFNDNFFFPKNTSNLIYFYINFFVRVTSPNEIIAIITLRITNSLIYIYSYLIVLDIFKLVQNKFPRIGFFDFLFLFNPISIYMFSRNVRDVYIFLLVLFFIKNILKYIKKGISFWDFASILIIVLFLIAFRFGFLVLLIIVAFLAYIVNIFSRKRTNKKRFRFNSLGFFSVILIFIILIFSFSNYFLNLILVAATIGADDEMRVVINTMNSQELFKLLLNKSLYGIPYFVLEPSLVNFIRFNSENNLQEFYSIIDLILIYASTIVNQFFIFPIMILSFLKTIHEKTIFSKGLLPFLNSFLLIFSFGVIIIYTASVISPDLRTKSFFILPFIIFLWINNYKTKGFSFSSLLIINVIVSSILIFIGLYF